jgi:co-chaperonin GroES (HSP10)
LLLPDPPKEETEYKIHIPDIAKVRPCTGKVLAAGLTAMDKLYDHGIEISDEVIWGQFAGVVWEWDHIKEYGKIPCVYPVEHSWTRAPSPRDRVTAAVCETCKTTRWTECVILANVDDIQASVDLGERKRNGVVAYRLGKDSEGKTTHFIDRKDK